MEQDGKKRKRNKQKRIEGGYDRTQEKEKEREDGGENECQRVRWMLKSVGFSVPRRADEGQRVN